jgi:UDP-N-acetylglucosamine 2-epimerase (non-hydrolysing)
MAPVIEMLKNHSNSIEHAVCVTGQHREMLDQILSFFDIQPDYDLDVMRESQTLVSLSSAILDGIQQVFTRFKPDIVLVQGDTTTATIAGLAAFYSGIKVHHVEAGLRTLDKYSPYPEEINRQVTARIADIHYAPTITAKNNLLDEGILPNQIWVTGNTVIDALFLALDKLENYHSDTLSELKTLLQKNKKLILVTGHRRESFGGGFQRIGMALKHLAHRDDVQIIYPVHLNPKVSIPVKELLGEINNIHLIDPLGYPEFLWLMNKAHIILTDSGGIQEEAPSLNIPVLVMRDTTEREEAIQAGSARLVGTDFEKIYSECSKLLDSTKEYEEMTQKANPFGDGNASGRILDIILD